MTSRDFCFWLQGFMELRGTDEINAEQAKCIAAHLTLVFKHEIDPSMGDAKHQSVLDEIHKAGKAQSPVGGLVIRC